MKKKVVIGMSGGVDSSVAAYLLKEKGYEVIGVTLIQTPKSLSNDIEDGGCCSISSVMDAKQVAKDLDIPHYVLNFRDIFQEKVIDYFIDEYLKGRTPNPCLMCNKFIRFDKFIKKSLEIGADYLATGHYARVRFDSKNKRYQLLKSKDSIKDQTYFLHQITQEQLSKVIFPLGKYNKQEVREIGEKIGITTFNKPDSEEICFIPNNNHGDFIKKQVPNQVKQGNFIDEKGNILGKHKGIVYYTIGQRKGLGLSLGKRVFVKSIDADRNEIIIGDEEGLYKDKLIANNLNWIGISSLESPMKVTAKIRHTPKEEKAEIIPLKNNKVLVKFNKKVRAIAEGQAIIFYDGDYVIGGGIIETSKI